MSLSDKKRKIFPTDKKYIYLEEDVKEFIQKLNTSLNNWEGDLTPQIVKEIIEELAGKELSNG